MPEILCLFKSDSHYITYNYTESILLIKYCMRLKTTEIKQYRNDALDKQQNICPLCGSSVEEDEATLDHDHDDGQVREVLHRSCNQAEGRIKSWINRSRFEGDDHVVFLKNLVQYLETDYSANPEHPNHLTKRCKRFKALNKTVQIDKLRELGVILEENHTKKELTKMYRKLIT